MQFHLNGFQPGDPEIADPAERIPAPGADGALPAEVDVLIVGCGPAGLTLAAQLSAFADIRTCIVEQKSGPLLRGQADGIACRTVEMFEAFGFSERVLKEACWINETTFWKPDEKNPQNIARSGRVQDVEDGLSEFPHVVLNQARVHDFYLDVMRRSPAKLKPYYNRRLVDLQIAAETAGGNADPCRVTARLEPADPAQGGRPETVKARYVVGCDGARSAVRKSIGRALHGDSANHAWGVMDVLAVTDFPDVRFKTLVQSAGEGSSIIIPREGGYLFRLYIELDKLAAGERVANRSITSDHLIAAAQRIFRPYTFDVKEVAWWSVYEIGQRLCDKFDDVPDAQAGGVDWNWNSRYWRSFGAPWGGAITTTSDMSRFCQCLAQGGEPLFSPATVREATTNRLLDFPGIPDGDRRSRGWGYGWRMNWKDHRSLFADLLPAEAYGHWGATGTLCWIDPERELSAVLLSTRSVEREVSPLTRLSNMICAAAR